MSIVVGYVATAEGRAAVEAAVAESRLRDLPVVLVASQRDDQDPQALRTSLEAVTSELTAAGVPHEVRISTGGDFADQLIGAAEELDAAVVVLGLRRRSPVGKLILGASAQRVLFDAPCPVLTAKPAS